MKDLNRIVDFVFELIRMYKEPHRKYHNLSHIEDCLWKFDLIKHLLENPDLVEVALMGHDAIYDPTKKDNEERSATLTTDYMRTNPTNWSNDQIAAVHQLIMATKHTWPYPKGHDIAYMVDIDLSGLGASRKAFFEAGRNIRDEYAFVPIDLFCEKRVEFLSDLLVRPSIFQTTVFNRLFEEKARENIEEAIFYLEKGEDKHYV